METVDLHELVMNGYKADSRTNSAHQEVLRELARRNIQTMDMVDVASAYSYLCFMTDLFANREGALLKVKEEDGTIQDHYIDETKFPQEIALMHSLKSRMVFSQKTENWLVAARHDFEDHLAQDDNFRSLGANWPNMTPGDRKAYIQDYIANRARIFSNLDFQFKTPTVDVEELAGYYGAACTTENKIILDKKLFQSDDLRAALLTAYHEGTHNLFTQLAMADYENAISLDHPLYEDIRMLNLTRQFGGDDTFFQSLYYIDPEERLCYGQQDAFWHELCEGRGLSARFKAAIQAAKHTWTGSPIAALKKVVNNFNLH